MCVWPRETKHRPRGAYDLCWNGSKWMPSDYGDIAKTQLSIKEHTYGADERRRRFLIEVTEHGSIQDACKAIPISYSAYQKWRKQYPQFAAEVDLARGIARSERMEYLADFATFRRLYLGMDTTWFQQHAVKALEQAKQGEIVLLLWPPEHGKTTLIEDFINMRLGLDPSTRITVVSERKEHAMKILRRVRNRMEPDGPAPNYVLKFGPFVPDEKDGKRAGAQPWAADHFDVRLRGVFDERDYNCVDQQTEILTARGWLTSDELEVGDQAYGLDPDTGLGRWTPVLHVHRLPRADWRWVLKLENKNHSSVTTEDHRWLVWHRGWLKQPELTWRTSKELNSTDSVPTNAPCVDLPTEAKYSDALVELLAWYWTEGSISKVSERNWRVQIGQSHRVNPTKVARIRACLHALFGEPVKGKRDGTGWSELRHEGRGMTLFNVWTNGARVLDDLAPDKHVRPEVIAALTRAQLRLFMDTSIDADGHWGAVSPVITQTVRSRLDAFGMACALLGERTSLYRNDVRGCERWVMTVIANSDRHCPIGAALRNHGEAKWEIYEESVWCPTTGTGTWFARRNGRTYFTGNCAAVGINTAIQGQRADWLLIDDCQSLKSANLTADYVDKLRQDFFSRPGMFGRICLLGTRVGNEDVYETLIDAGLIDKLIVFPAYRQTLHGEVEWLWPERYTPEMYEGMRKRVGEQAWARNYMQRPSAAKDSTFDREMIAGCHNEARSVIADCPREGDRMTRVCVSLDPSLGGANAITALGFHTKRLLYLSSRVDHGLTRNEQIFDLLEQTIIRWNHPGISRVHEVVIEANAFQKGLLDDDRIREIIRRYGVRVIPHTTGVNKHDPNIGVASMALSFMRAEIDLPYSDKVSREEISLFTAEFCAWLPTKRGNILRQDRVMSWWFGYLRWKSQRAAVGVDTAQFSSKASPLRVGA